jgi:hypothetical protein
MLLNDRCDERLNSFRVWKRRSIVIGPTVRIGAITLPEICRLQYRAVYILRFDVSSLIFCLFHTGLRHCCLHLLAGLCSCLFLLDYDCCHYDYGNLVTYRRKQRLITQSN